MKRNQLLRPNWLYIGYTTSCKFMTIVNVNASMRLHPICPSLRPLRFAIEKGSALTNCNPLPPLSRKSHCPSWRQMGTGLRYQSLRFCHYRENFSNLVCRNSSATIVGFPENKKQQRLVLGEKKAKKRLKPLLLLRLAPPP